MNAPQDITSAVDEMLEQFMAATGRCDTRDVVQAVLSSWSAPGGADEDKWAHCGYMAISKVVADRSKAFRPDKQDDDRQGILPGYEKLHRRYTVNGKIVAVDKLTVAEALDVLAELERCEQGLRIHKNELRRFIDEVLIPAGNGN